MFHEKLSSSYRRWPFGWRTAAWLAHCRLADALLFGLAHYCLASESIEPFSISSVIYANKKDYYEILEQTTKLENNLNFDFTAWIKWHLEAVNSAIKQAISS